MTTLVESEQEPDAGSPLQKEALAQALSLTELPNNQSDICVGKVYDTASLMEVLFPSPTLGQAFFKQFMQQAQSEQVTLPDEPASVVVICTKSIATLGQKLGFSNDTTHKYVVLFKALGLLKKRKVMGQQAFVLAIGIYQAPETLEANLDHLILRCNNKKSRNKFHQLLLDVKQRCLIYGLITQDITHTLILLDTLLHPMPGETKLRMMRRFAQAQYLVSTLTTHIMQRTHYPQRQWVDSPPQGDAAKSTQRRATSHIIPSTTQQTDSFSVESTIHPLSDSMEKQVSSSQQQNLPWHPASQEVQEDEIIIPSTKHILSGRRKDTHTSTPGSMHPSLLTYQVDSHADLSTASTSIKAQLPQSSTHTSLSNRRREAPMPAPDNQHKNLPEKISTQPAYMGRHTQEELQENLPNVLHQLDATRHRQQHTPQNEDHTSRFSANLPLPAVPRTTEQVDSAESLRNVDVINIYNFFTFTLREPRKVAEFLAEQFEHDISVYPKYLKLFFVQPGQPRDPHVLAAAFICTVVHVYLDHWNLDRPGGYFTKMCRIYDTGIPEEAETWIAQYGAMSFTQFLATLTRQAKEHRGRTDKPAHAILPTQEGASKPSPAPRLPPLATAPQLHADTTRMVMSKDEANALIQCILRDVSPRRVRVGLVRAKKTQAHYAVLIDAIVPGSQTIDQLLVYTQQEWQERLAGATSWYNLFHHIKTTDTQ